LTLKQLQPLQTEEASEAIRSTTKSLTISPMKKYVYLLLFVCSSALAQPNAWKKVEDGLWYGEFKAGQESVVGDSKIYIVKCNAAFYQFKLLCISELNHGMLTAKEWREQYGLILATNAGMFETDYKTHTGYAKNFSHFNNATPVKKYQSVVAFNAVNKSTPTCRIFDTEMRPLDSIAMDYHTVIQNLRLIKRPKENKWGKSKRQWSEMALGEDSDGNILFVFSRSPYSMRDLNAILLKLPINLIALQHLEGGPEASLSVSHNGFGVEFMGSYETGFTETDDNKSFWKLPNVIGIVRKP